MIESEEHCGFQFFIADHLSEESLREMIKLLYVYTEFFGPVILICTEAGYDFIVRNNFAELYIDIGICDSEDSVWGLVTHLKETGQMEAEHIINNLKNCSEKMRSLYTNAVLPKRLSELLEKAVLKEQIKNAI